jgi:hypothetical protein
LAVTGDAIAGFMPAVHRRWPKLFPRVLAIYVPKVDATARSAHFDLAQCRRTGIADRQAQMSLTTSAQADEVVR